MRLTLKCVLSLFFCRCLRNTRLTKTTHTCSTFILVWQQVTVQCKCDTGLRKVCESMGMPKDEWFSAYTFRHTWGTVAQNDCGATIDEVAFAMNHSNGHAVTRGYIKLDFSPAWELNKKVIDFIFLFLLLKANKAKHKVLMNLRMKSFASRQSIWFYARAYFRGQVLAEVSDIGFSNIEEVIATPYTDVTCNYSRTMCCTVSHQECRHRTRGCLWANQREGFLVILASTYKTCKTRTPF